MRLIGVLTLTALLLPAAARAQAQKTAVVDPGRVFSEMKETKALQQKFDDLKSSLQKQLDSKQADLRKLQEQREQLKKGTPQYDALTRDLSKGTVELKVWYESTKYDLDHQQMAQTLALFGKIRSAVADVAKEKGIDLVVADQGADLHDIPDQMTMDQLRRELGRINVLYSSGTADITSDVIAKLDAAYAAAGNPSDK